MLRCVKWSYSVALCCIALCGSAITLCFAELCHGMKAKHLTLVTCFRIPSGCNFPLPTFGLHVYFPPNAVTEPVDINCTVIPEAKCSSLPTRGDTLVSNIVRIEPENVEFSEAAVVSLMHCHPKQTLGYENVVKFLDPSSQEWKEYNILAELDGLVGMCTNCYCCCF